MDSTWTIEEQCPQCGAPVTLEETDRIFTCSFCRVRLYIVSDGFSRYRLPPPKDHTDEIIYAPYWRVRGMAFSFFKNRMDNRIIDFSRLAVGHDILPVSLGFKPQALKLRFLEPDTGGKFLKRKLSLKKIMSEMLTPEDRLTDAPPAIDRVHRGFIGETVSLIYAPFYLKDYRFFDAILQEPVKTAPEAKRPKSLPLVGKKDWKRAFLPTLCPLCGWDMGGAAESCILVCTGCGSAWKAAPSGFRRVEFEIIRAAGENILYVPFWKMETRIDALDLKSFGDLARLINLPKVPQQAWKEQKLYFWAPGFKIAPKIFLRLSKQMTLSNFTLKGENGTKTEGTSFFPVTLPSSEAAESVQITLFQLFINHKKVYPLLPEVKISVLNQELIYLPFVIRSNEVVQYHLKFSISKNALKIGRKL